MWDVVKDFQLLLLLIPPGFYPWKWYLGLLSHTIPALQEGFQKPRNSEVVANTPIFFQFISDL